MQKNNSGRRGGKSVHAALALVDQMKKAKEGETIAIASKLGMRTFRCIKVEEVPDAK